MGGSVGVVELFQNRIALFHTRTSHSSEPFLNHSLLNRGARAEYGTEEDKECLRYVLDEEAGSSAISFQVCFWCFGAVYSTHMGPLATHTETKSAVLKLMVSHGWSIRSPTTDTPQGERDCVGG